MIFGPGWVMLLSVVHVVFFFCRASCIKETLFDFC